MWKLQWERGGRHSDQNTRNVLLFCIQQWRARVITLTMPCVRLSWLQKRWRWWLCRCKLLCGPTPPLLPPPLLRPPPLPLPGKASAGKPSTAGQPCIGSTKRSGSHVRVQGGAVNIMSDLGCGSGLSAAAVRQAAGSATCVLGCDASPAMLALATASAGGCVGSVLLSNFGQGLPFRSSSLDGAISISALQARQAGGQLFLASEPAGSICVAARPELLQRLCAWHA